MKNIFSNWRQDLPASLVVFLVALPLCLGVGLASTSVEGIAGMPNIFSGIIAGVAGGIVVGIFSGSRLGVSGPAAGLIAIVAAAIVTIGSFEGFLLAVVFSGVMQLIAGFAGAGILGNYFPSSVIKGMLAAIGLTLILKEIPHALGYDADFMGDEAFIQPDGHNTFSELFYALNAFHPGAIIISLISLAILILFDKPFMKKIALFKFLPGALFVVVIGVLLNELFRVMNPNFYIDSKHLVSLPVASSISEFGSFFSSPDFSFLSNPNVYVVGFTIALVGSLETLLSVEATDKLDPEKHHTPTNKELKAQGIGNIVSGLLGGLPVTQVIVRSSANINSGGKSKLSTIMHGILLMLTVIFIPSILNMIPLASLAAILLMVGYKLAKIQLFKQMYKLGIEQFLPFFATIVAVMFTDLLKGIAVGMAIAIFFILRKNYRNNYQTSERTVIEGKEIVIQLSEEVTFLNKGSIQNLLDELEENCIVIIDGSNCHMIDHDVLEIIQDFRDFGSREKNIQLTTINIPEVTVSGGH
jgi:MFS superfamily sulfate permease-like transporter